MAWRRETLFYSPGVITRCRGRTAYGETFLFHIHAGTLMPKCIYCPISSEDIRLLALLVFLKLGSCWVYLRSQEMQLQLKPCRALWKGIHLDSLHWVESVFVARNTTSGCWGSHREPESSVHLTLRCLSRVCKRCSLCALNCRELHYSFMPSIPLTYNVSLAWRA